MAHVVSTERNTGMNKTALLSYRYRAVSAPDLTAQGYRLIGGRVLSTMISPAAMLVFILLAPLSPHILDAPPEHRA